jgi:hypothetical protein
LAGKDTKKPGFLMGRASQLRGVYAEIIGASNKREKHGRSYPTGRNRAVL